MAGAAVSMRHRHRLEMASPLFLFILVTFAAFTTCPFRVEAAAVTAKVVHDRRVATAAAVSDPLNSSRPFAVFGYLPEYRQSQFAYEDFFELGLTHLIFFSAEVDGRTGGLLHADDRLPSSEEWRTIRASADQHNVRLMLCVGGGGRSEGFAEMVAEPFRRVRFIDDLNQLLLERHMDGVDINWEYPQGKEQWDAFAQLIREMRSSLGYVRVRGLDDGDASSTSPAGGDLSGKEHQAEQERVFSMWKKQQEERRETRDVLSTLVKNKANRQATAKGPTRRMRLRAMTLTMAIHPHPDIAAMMHELNILPWLDYLHLMAYDYIQPDQPHTSLQYAQVVLSDRYIGALAHGPPRMPPSVTAKAATAIKGSGGDDDSSEVDIDLKHGKAASLPSELRRAIKASGATLKEDPRRKLTLGIPFYGRHVENFHLEAETYEHLQLFISQWAAKYHPEWKFDGTNEEVKAMNSYMGYAFDSYRDVQAKMRLARRAGPIGGIGGIMIWELGQDVRPPLKQPLSLMRAVGEQLALWNASKPLPPVAVGSKMRKGNPVVQPAKGSSEDKPHASSEASPNEAPKPTKAASKDIDEGDL